MLCHFRHKLLLGILGIKQTVYSVYCTLICVSNYLVQVITVTTSTRPITYVQKQARLPRNNMSGYLKGVPRSHAFHSPKLVHRQAMSSLPFYFTYMCSECESYHVSMNSSLIPSRSRTREMASYASLRRVSHKMHEMVISELTCLVNYKMIYASEADRETWTLYSEIGERYVLPSRLRML